MTESMAIYETAAAHAVLILTVLSLQVPLWAIYMRMRKGGAAE
jgi:hypothetical protein